MHHAKMPEIIRKPTPFTIGAIYVDEYIYVFIKCIWEVNANIINIKHDTFIMKEVKKSIGKAKGLEK